MKVNKVVLLKSDIKPSLDLYRLLLPIGEEFVLSLYCFFKPLILIKRRLTAKNKSAN